MRHTLPQLVTAWQNGNDRVGTELTTHVDRLAHNTIRLMLKGRPLPGYDADDLLQELRLAVFGAIPGYDPTRAEPSTWITAVCSNRLSQLIESNLRLSRHPSGCCYLQELGYDPASAENLEDTIIRRAMADLIASLAADDTQRALIAGLRDGRNLCEIARDAGISRQAARRIRDTLATGAKALLDL